MGRDLQHVRHDREGHVFEAFDLSALQCGEQRTPVTADPSRAMQEGRQGHTHLRTKDPVKSEIRLALVLHRYLTLRHGHANRAPVGQFDLGTHPARERKHMSRRGCGPSLLPGEPRACPPSPRPPTTTGHNPKCHTPGAPCFGASRDIPPGAARAANVIITGSGRVARVKLRRTLTLPALALMLTQPRACQ